MPAEADRLIASATLSRRAFLNGSARALLPSGAGLGVLASAGCSGSVPSAAPVAPNVWAQLQRRLTGRVVRPGDAGFATLALPNNLRYAGVQPAGIALCANAEDVSASILWAREFGVSLVARSGGHSYGGYSTTTGLMIDVSRMRGVSYDASTGIATLQGGARNADVYAALRRVGRAITHGRCYRVGVAGLVLGGGVGFNMRTNGVTSDQLAGSEIVTADGELRALGPTQHPDLFWACRGGGGGNFGINTAFAFATFAVDRLTVFSLTWTREADAVLAALLGALEAAPRTLGCKLSVAAPSVAQRARGDDLKVVLIGQLEGTRAELLEILSPAYAVAHPSGDIREDGYWAGQDFLSEQGDPEYFHEVSRFYEGPFDDRSIGFVLDGMRRWPGTAESATFKLFQTGGAMNAVAPSASAFVHRSSEWLASIGLVWSARDDAGAVRDNLAWQRAFYDSFVPLAKGGAYQNFIDPGLVDWKAAYYGENLARLEAVKARYDPNRIFRFQESIPT